MRQFMRAAVAALVVAAGMAVAIPPAAALDGFSFTRFAGQNRFDTARLIANDFGNANTIVLARGDLFPDAMAGSYLAGVEGAPIILTRSDSLPPETDSAIRAVAPSRALILGGTSAIAQSVEIALRARGLAVERVSGATRYDTAQQVAQRVDPSTIGRLDGLRTALLASGVNFPDAIAAGPVAYAGRFPLLLTAPGSLSPQTNEAITNLGIGQVLVLGGTSAVSSSVDAALRARGLAVSRLAGANRSATSIEIAGLGIRRLGFSEAHVNIARGDDFADALALAPHAARDAARPVSSASTAQAAQTQTRSPAPILLTASSTSASDELIAELRARARTLSSGHIAGGTAAISEALERQLADAARGGFSTISLEFSTVRPGGNVPGMATGEFINTVSASGCGLTNQIVRNGPGAFTLTIPAFQSAGQCFVTFTTTFTNGLPAETDQKSLIVSEAASNQTYSISGPSSTNQSVNTDRVCTATVPISTPLDIRLLPTAAVTAGSNGEIRLNDADANNLADEPGVTADIVAVNGAPVTAADEVNDVTSPSTSMTVTIRSAGPEDVTLVVWADQPGLNGNAIDLTVPTTANASPKTPREPFGVGCRTTFVPGDAPASQFGPLTIQSTDKANDLFVAGGQTFRYDSNDTFLIDGVQQSTGAAAVGIFESRLSPGDQIQGNYAGTPGAVSTFNLTDTAPLAPTSLSASSSGTTITANFTESQTATTDSYTLYTLLRPASGVCPDFGVASGRSQYATSGTTTDPTPTTAGTALLQIVASGFQANATYCLAVVSVDEGDESPNGPQTTVTTGSAPGGGGGTTTTTTTTVAGTSAPRINDLRAEDAGGGTLNAGDLIQAAFNEPLALASDDPGASFGITDQDGTTATITCGTNAACALLPAGNYNGVVAAANQAMRIRLTATPTASGGTFAGLQYGSGTLVTSTSQVRDIDGNNVDLPGSPDRILDIGAVSPASDTTAPTIVSREESGTDQVTVTFSEPITAICGVVDLLQFSLSTGSGTFNPSSASINGSQLVLTFGAASPVENNPPTSESTGSGLTYSDTGAAPDCDGTGGDIADLSLNQAAAPSSGATTDT